MIVLDANILIRAVLGKRVLDVIATYGTDGELCAPDSAFQEALEYIPALLGKRGVPEESGVTAFRAVAACVQEVPREFYSTYEAPAQARMAARDPDDWPVAAAALALQCPIWTEDRDFFGCGIATWTTDRVEIYFKQSGQ